MLKWIIVRLARLAVIYYNAIEFAVDKLFSPLSDFIGSYSPVLGESVKNISKLMVNTLSVLPFISASIFFGVLFYEDSIEIWSGMGSIQPISILSFVLILAGVFSLITSYVALDNNARNTAYVTLLLLISGIAVYTIETPEVYVVLLAIFYGIGGYTATFIKFDTPLSHDYVYNELKPQKYIATISIISSIPIGILVFFLYSQQVEQWIRISIVISCGLLSHMVTVLQREKYETIYENVGPRLNSQVWVLTPRLLVIIGCGLSLSIEQETAYLFLCLMPCSFGLLFYYYMKRKYRMMFGHPNIKDSKGIHRETPSPKTDKKLEIIDKNIGEESANIEVKVGFNLKEVYNKDNTPWYEALGIMQGLESVGYTMSKTSDKDSIEDIERFYDKIIDKIIRENRSEIVLTELDERIQKRFISRLSEKGHMNNQDIMDLEIKESDNKTRGEKMYSDKS